MEEEDQEREGESKNEGERKSRRGREIGREERKTVKEGAWSRMG